MATMRSTRLSFFLVIVLAGESGDGARDYAIKLNAETDSMTELKIARHGHILQLEICCNSESAISFCLICLYPKCRHKIKQFKMPKRQPSHMRPTGAVSTLFCALEIPQLSQFLTNLHRITSSSDSPCNPRNRPLCPTLSTTPNDLPANSSLQHLPKSLRLSDRLCRYYSCLVWLISAAGAEEKGCRGIF
jgi:hypothetical protein